VLHKLKLKIELVTDWQLHLDTERALRGGLCLPFQPHALANDPATPEYNPELPPSAIAYFDANSLYNYCMQQCLPYQGYEQEPESLQKLYDLIDAFQPDDDVGYLFVVDLYVPAQHHDRLDWAPIRKAATMEGGPEKLFPFLGGQDEYALTLPLAHFYNKSMGVRFKKVHRMWRYKQAPYLRDHVMQMAAKRAEAKSEIMKDTLKKCPNSYYGCTVENMMNRMDLAPYANEYEFEQAVARTWRPGLRAFVKYHYPNGDFLGYRERRPLNGIVLRSPRLVGVAILDLAKVHMLRFHYDFIKPQFGADARLLYTDTDSTILHITGVRSVREVMLRDPTWFDFSNGKKLGWTEMPENSGIAGPFKSELVDKAKGKLKHAVEYAGSEAKCYGLRIWPEELEEDGSVKPPYLRCKGNPQCVVKKQITFQKMKDAALNQLEACTSFRRIQLKSSSAQHVQVKKVALRGANDKVVRIDNATFLPLGHYRCALHRLTQLAERSALRHGLERLRLQDASAV
jgi:hypothetical protein